MNERVKGIEISGIRKFFNKVKEVDGAISLTLGQPDFNCPNNIKKAMILAIEEDKTIYTENSGLLQLRYEISKYLKGCGISYNEEEICITVGGSEGLYSVFTSLINVGDKVLIPTPGYPAYESITRILGGEVINYYLNDDFSLNIEGIKEKIINENIKFMVLSYPSNPTGATLKINEKEALSKIIKETGVIVITDEIYASLCYENYISIAQEKELKDNIIYVSGFSKMFSFTGLRVGYVACNKRFMEQIMKVHQYNVSCAPSIAQYGIIDGLRLSMNEVIEMKETFKYRRDYVLKRLREIGFTIYEPKGAFYVFPSIKKFNMTSEEFCDGLLYKGKVACVPGSAFGVGGEGYFRISYCYSINELKEALDRIEKYIFILRNSEN